MNQLSTAYGYAEGVRDGKIVVNKLVRLAIERHYRDIENQSIYYFDETAAQKALTFFDFLVLSKGVSVHNVPPEQINADGTIRFDLQPWQCFMIASLFGWKKRSDGKRRFTEAYVEIPKKSGKTTLASGIANYMLIADQEAGPEVYVAAYTRDQASICFDESISQIKNSPNLKKRVTILKYSVSIPKRRAKMTAVSHDADNTEGKNAHCVILDEYHVHKTDKVKDSLQSGQAAREQPLLFIITTAGYNKQGPCYKHRELCVGMLESRYALDNVFALVYGLDDDDDWKLEENWAKAIPSLGVTVQMDYLRREFQKALRSGSKEVDFKTKHLNVWTDAEVRWISAEDWDTLARPDFIPPRNAPFYAGIDLASTSDIAALTLFFPVQRFFMHRFYVPKAAADKVRGGIAYHDWVQDGHLLIAGEKTTDYEHIREEIFRLADQYDLHFGAIDRWNSTMLTQQLNDAFEPHYVSNDEGDKFSYEPRIQLFGQGFASLSGPTKGFEAEVLEGTVTHDGNPVMGWMMGNVAIAQDAAGNIKPDKSKSQDKIDGVVSSIMAFGMFQKWYERMKNLDQINAW